MKVMAIVLSIGGTAFCLSAFIPGSSSYPHWADTIAGCCGGFLLGVATVLFLTRAIKR